jgi:hypothetical protein
VKETKNFRDRKKPHKCDSDGEEAKESKSEAVET